MFGVNIATVLLIKLSLIIRKNIIISLYECCDITDQPLSIIWGNNFQS